MNRDETGNREFLGLEQTLVDLLRTGQSLTLDDIAGVLPGDCFAQVFLIIDRWSRSGIVRLVPGVGGYRVELLNETVGRTAA